MRLAVDRAFVVRSLEKAHWPALTESVFRILITSQITFVAHYNYYILITNFTNLSVVGKITWSWSVSCHDFHSLS